ncbi:MAG TPA: branched-chain amino acid ABC transporter substrate-binding protein [Solirubrobacteraceae bacterium]|nr:branched-chain amino acid ABC transporter substrate-binding protein [Solirubrobacteraceae bacterium]
MFALSAFGVAACGDDDEAADTGGATTTTGETAGKELTIYSSLPLQGASRPQTTAMVNGIRLALKEADNKAGNFTIKYQSLDDSTAQAGTWTPEATSQNARRAAQDENIGAYIGEFNSGASAVSIPILSEAKVPQVSPANTAVGLTSDEPGAEKGEPEKYYPTGFRNYVRIVPKDTIQGSALATVMKEDGCTKVAMANDREVYGAGLSRNIEMSAEDQDLKILFNDGIDPKAANYRSLASRAKNQGADCFVYSGITANNAVQLFKDFEAALPDAKLYGPDGVAESGFADPKEGGIPASVAKKVKVTVATLDPASYPPEGRQFFEQFEKEYGEPNPDPYAIYGYEAMRLALDAIERSETGEKEDIVKALFATEDRSSVLGTYSIDDNGDTTLTDYGVYSIKDGELEFEKTVKAATS